MLRVLSVSALCVSSAVISTAELHAQQIRTLDLGTGLHMIAGAGGNLAVSTGNDGMFLVDDQVAAVTPQLRDVLAGLGSETPRFIINTHWHGDHTGGNEAMGGDGSIIVAHENVRVRMSMPQFIEDLNNRTQASPEVALPAITFTSELTFHWNGDSITVRHLDPAHTDGDAIVIFHRANVIHAGDIFFNRLYPFIDRSSGGSAEGVIRAANEILELADPATRIIPGHGGIASRDDLVAYRNMLRAVVRNVRRLIDDGATLEEVIAARPSADYDDAWGQGFLNPENFLTILYRDLSD